MRTRLKKKHRLFSKWRLKCKAALRKTQVDHLMADLSHCTAAMKHECKQVETDFLDIGEYLQAIHSQASLLTQNAQCAVKHIGLDHENNLLAEITRTTHRAMADLDREQSRIQESLKFVQAVGDRLHSMLNMIAGLKQIADTLKVVAVNINIESSRSAESQEFFKLMPGEIRSLSDTMLEVVCTLSNETETIADNLGAAHQSIEHKLDHFYKLVRDARLMVTSTAQVVRDLINRSIQAFQHVGNDAQVLSQSVGEIVQSIQIHDNISQRVQHVAAALTDACQNLANSNERPKAILLMDANLELQQSQYNNILLDINDTYQQGVRAFDTIGRTVEDIAMNLADIVAVGAAGRSNEQCMGNSIEPLKDALKKIRRLIGQGMETVAELKGSIQEAMAVVAQISDRMEYMLDVNFDIHLKSLNAIIGSTRLGDEGKSIVVLVQEMEGLSKKSNKIVAEVDKINTAIMNDVDLLHKRIESTSGEGDPTVEKDRADINNGIRDFDVASTTFSKGADNVAHSSHTLAEQVRTAADKLSFLKSFAGQIQSQLLQLNAFRTRLTPWVDAGSGFVMLDKERLAARYTMQKERDIQANVLTMADPEGESWTAIVSSDGSAVHLEAAACKQDEHTTTECELGDNVELF